MYNGKGLYNDTAEVQMHLAVGQKGNIKVVFNYTNMQGAQEEEERSPCFSQKFHMTNGGLTIGRAIPIGKYLEQRRQPSWSGMRQKGGDKKGGQNFNTDTGATIAHLFDGALNEMVWFTTQFKNMEC